MRVLVWLVWRWTVGVYLDVQDSASVPLNAPVLQQTRVTGDSAHVRLMYGSCYSTDHSCL